MGPTAMTSRWLLHAGLAMMMVVLSQVAQYYAPLTSTFAARFVRNAFLPGTPPPLPAQYPSTSDEELVEKVTVVIGAKDFISQTAEQIEFLGTLGWPVNMHVIISYSSTIGWETIEPAVMRAVASSPLRNVTLVDAGPFANPFTAWVDAAKKATTPQVLLMHSDMYPMDGRQFLTELYEASKVRPEYGVIAPELYEAETEGYLCHHTTQTNLHMRRKEDGTLFLGHDGDLVEGLNRRVSDFKERPQADFLEDHAFLIRRELIEPIVDPGAAYTMEYLDMAIGLRAYNTTVWYVPSSRTEYRVWHTKFRWQDATFFAYRRSERLARWTKDYLENKWGIKFPTTGFSNFVKFSVVRNAFFTREKPNELPDGWKQQASLYYAWFEVAGFNFFGAGKQLLPDFTQHSEEEMLKPTAALRAFPAYEPEQASPASGFDVEKLVDIREKNDLLETDLPTALLSTTVAQLRTNTSCSTPGSPIEALKPFCGLIIEDNSAGAPGCTCWLYIAPYGYDSPVYKGLESVLRFFNLPERIAVYAALKLENEDLSQAREELMGMLPSDSSLTYTVCSDGTETCQIQLEGFPAGARLLQWSFRLNSLTNLRKALKSASESEDAPFYLMLGWGFWVGVVCMIGVLQHPKVRKHIVMFVKANCMVCHVASRS